MKGKSDLERKWFKDVLHEFEVKEVDESIPELAIFITKRFTEEKIKEQIAQYIMMPQICEVLQVKTTNSDIWDMLRGQHYEDNRHAPDNTAK